MARHNAILSQEDYYQNLRTLHSHPSTPISAADLELDHRILSTQYELAKFTDRDRAMELRYLEEALSAAREREAARRERYKILGGSPFERLPAEVHARIIYHIGPKLQPTKVLLPLTPAFDEQYRRVFFRKFDLTERSACLGPAQIARLRALAPIIDRYLRWLVCNARVPTELISEAVNLETIYYTVLTASTTAPNRAKSEVEGQERSVWGAILALTGSLSNLTISSRHHSNHHGPMGEILPSPCIDLSTLSCLRRLVLCTLRFPASMASVFFDGLATLPHLSELDVEYCGLAAAPTLSVGSPFGHPLRRLRFEGDLVSDSAAGTQRLLTHVLGRIVHLIENVQICHGYNWFPEDESSWCTDRGLCPQTWLGTDVPTPAEMPIEPVTVHVPCRRLLIGEMYHTWPHILGSFSIAFLRRLELPNRYIPVVPNAPSDDDLIEISAGLGYLMSCPQLASVTMPKPFFDPVAMANSLEQVAGLEEAAQAEVELEWERRQIYFEQVETWKELMAQRDVVVTYKSYENLSPYERGY